MKWEWLDRFDLDPVEDLAVIAMIGVGVLLSVTGIVNMGIVSTILHVLFIGFAICAVAFVVVFISFLTVTTIGSDE